jgi:signal peptidase I
MSERSTPRHRLREVLLNAGAMLGVMSILLAATALVFGITPLVFRSGSMAPAAHTGDLGIAQTVPAAELRVGDIVTVLTSADVRVTHRIVELEQTDTGALLVLKGDANEDPDPEQYAVAEAQRLLFAIPRAGYVASWLSGPGGVFLGGLLVGLVFLVVLQATSRKPPSGRRRADTTARTSVVILGAALLATTLTHLPQPVGTLAAWNDSVDVTGASMTGYTVPAPEGSTCTLFPGGTNTVRGVRLTWPATVAPLPALSYTTPTSTNITTITNSVTTVGSDKVLTQTYNPGTVANQNKIVTVTNRAFPTGAATWLSPVTTWKYRTGSANTVQPVCGEVTPPELEFVAPDATTRTVTAERSFITTACTTSSVIACGTYVDASTVTVAYTLRRVATVGGAVRCWTGSWSTTAVGGACTTFQAAAVATSGGLKTWYEMATQTTVYPASGGAGVYTLTVQATDSWANVTTKTQTFTLT